MDPERIDRLQRTTKNATNRKEGKVMSYRNGPFYLSNVYWTIKEQFLMCTPSRPYVLPAAKWSSCEFTSPVAWTIVKTTLRKELQYEEGMRRGVGRNIVHAIVLS